MEAEIHGGQAPMSRQERLQLARAAQKAHRGASGLTRNQAIRRFCAECMGAPREATYREAINATSRLVRDCTSTACPLHDYRMGSPRRGA